MTDAELMVFVNIVDCTGVIIHPGYVVEGDEGYGLNLTLAIPFAVVYVNGNKLGSQAMLLDELLGVIFARSNGSRYHPPRSHVRWPTSTQPSTNPTSSPDSYGRRTLLPADIAPRNCLAKVCQNTLIRLLDSPPPPATAECAMACLKLE